MDFLDPRTERRSQTKLLLGYCLVALAIGIATLLLLYQAYGYNIDRQGEVTQSGLLFVASQPNGSAVYLNGKRYKSDTDTRAVVPAGAYNLHISQTGYRPWDRPLWVAGNDVQHFDYAFLFPETLQTAPVADLAADPSAALQSPDRRWLLLGTPDVPGSFAQYDLKNPAKPVANSVALPAGSFTPGTGVQTWTTVEWATNNRQVLLQHSYVSGSGTNHEYILLDRDTPANSVNLTAKLNLNQNQTLGLFDGHTDQFYAYDITALTLQRLNLSDASVASKLDHVLAFKPYGDNRILYITDQSPTGKTTPGLLSAVLQSGQQTTTLRTLPAAGNGSFVLSLGQYSGDLYAAVGATSDSAVYVYKNPQSQHLSGTDTYPAPDRRLHIANPSSLSFSTNSQFLLAQSGQDFVVYDLENIAQYHYTATQPIDAPQGHAVWMDDDRLAYVSDGKLVVFDYDYRNQQTLVAANSLYLPFFAPDYSYLYTLRAASGDAKAALTSTSMVVEQ